MNTNIDIENIFLHKDYHELSADEKLAIKDIAENEVTFNDTKLMMSSIQNHLNDIPEISPKKESKEELLATFKKVRPAATEKTVGLGLLFPKDKSFFQKPGFQMLAAAAVIIFIITIFNSNIFTKPENEMAQNEVTEDVKSTQPQNAVTEENEKEENSNSEYLEDKTTKDVEDKNQVNKSIKNEAQISPNKEIEKVNGTVNYYTDNLNVATTEKPDFASKNQEIESSQNIVKDIAIEDNQIDDHIAIKGTTTINNNYANVLAASEMVQVDEVASKSSFDKNVNKKRSASFELNKPKLSKTLSENAELINLFYTAM